MAIQTYGTQPLKLSTITGTWNDPNRNRVQELSQIMANNMQARSEYQQQIDSLLELRNDYAGEIDWITRWLIDQQVKSLKQQKSQCNSTGATAAYELEKLSQSIEGRMDMSQAEEEAYMGKWNMWQGALEGGQSAGPNPPTELPLPEWLNQYLESSQPQGVEGAKKGAFALKPLGAQADIPLEQLQQMAGYLGWTKAGAPIRWNQRVEPGVKGMSAGESYLTQIQNRPDWWQAFQSKYESMWPRMSKLPKTNWAPFRQ